MLRGEIVILDHCHPLGGKIEGTRSTPYYSKRKLPSLAYFTTTIQVISHAKNKRRR
jgi:hypothetical protein